MKIDLEIMRPFGPQVLISKCPEKILNQINDFVERVENSNEDKELYSSLSGNLPNLLLRDIENIFLPYNFCREIGLKKVLEDLTNTYHDYYEQSTIKESFKLSPVISQNRGDHGGFVNSDKIIYADCWVNRYFSGHYTPIHTHGADISGVIFLKIPQKELQQEATKNIESQGLSHNNDYDVRDSGRLNFVYGSNQSYCENIWKPDQIEGNILIFPAWLNHLVYPQKTNKERRTLSFNLICEDEYYARMGEYHENYQGD